MNVAFYGHNEVANEAELSQWLDTILPKLIEQGASIFYFTDYGKFDLLAAQSVKKLKTKHTHIYSLVAIPSFDVTFDHDLYDFGLYSSSLNNLHPSHAIVKRNEWLAGSCDIIVSGVTRDGSEAAKTLEYAWKKDKIIIQFPDTNLKI